MSPFSVPIFSQFMDFLFYIVSLLHFFVRWTKGDRDNDGKNYLKIFVYKQFQTLKYCFFFGHLLISFFRCFCSDFFISPIFCKMLQSQIKLDITILLWYLFFSSPFYLMNHSKDRSFLGLQTINGISMNPKVVEITNTETLNWKLCNFKGIICK